MCINDEAGKQSFQVNCQRGGVFFIYVSSLGSSICARPTIYFSAPLFFYQIYCPRWSFLMWYCEAVGFRCPHYFYVFHFLIFLINGYHCYLSMFLMPFSAVIWVNVISTSSLCMLCIKKKISQCWWQMECHISPLQTSFRGTQPLFLRWPFLDLFLCLNSN